MKDTTLQDKATQALKDCLKDVPFVEVKQVRKNRRKEEAGADIVMAVRLKDGSVQQIVAEVNASGQPRLAKEAVNQLFRYRTTSPKTFGVFIAPFVSPQSAEICLKAGFGYLDLAGNCRLSFRHVFILKSGFRNPFSERRDLRSLYSPKASRVLRVLLIRKADRWKTQALADEAGVSLGQVANVKKLLQNREWITEDQNGFRLANPQGLLAEWAETYTYRRNIVREFYSMKETDETEVDLARTCRDLDIPYALTGFSGARRVAPSVRAQRVMAYVSSIPEALVATAGLKEVPSGANVTLMIPYDEGVYYEAREIDSLRIVCPVQLYLDLKGYRGRGEEAADAVWKQVLSKIW